MTLHPPNLDDKRFDDLMNDTIDYIRRHCPEWTDLSPSDPGVVMLEAFAFLTEMLIYRLNRVPEKAYITFLKLLGVTLHPPSAAGTRLRFSVKKTKETPVVIPDKTEVTLERSGDAAAPPVFITREKAVIKPGETHVDVDAFHCTYVTGEQAGYGTGKPGLLLRLKHSPVVVASFGKLEFIVGVETDPDLLDERTPAITYQNKIYRIWSEVPHFATTRADQTVYAIDRSSGTIRFAPEIQTGGTTGSNPLLAEACGKVVEKGREIRVWYHYGGGPQGNVGPNVLTRMKSVVPGVMVTNLFPATGGRDIEPLSNAIKRGPKELHSLERAVTAADFELLAQKSSGGVLRAKAFTKAALWSFAEPGTVDILLVPSLDTPSRGEYVTAQLLKSKETEEILGQIQNELDRRKPLGTQVNVNWVKYKTVNVNARVVVHKGQNPGDVKKRVMDRLYNTITPLPSQFHSTGWAFGKTLRISDIYDIILKEPGVNYADSVYFKVDDVPSSSVSSVTQDIFQKNMWFAAAGDALYRTMDDGQGWERILTVSKGNIESVCVSAKHPGAVALHTKYKEESGSGSAVYYSSDSGESWDVIAETAFEIENTALGERERLPLLFLATDVGLYELWTKKGSVPIQILVDAENMDVGFYSVITSFDNLGTEYVVAASQREKGIYMSSSGGKSGTFKNIGFTGTDIRALAVQIDGPRSFLWVGITVMGSEKGEGCHRIELRGSELSPDGWLQFDGNWDGGSCRAMAFKGPVLLAATHRAGILALDTSGRSKAFSRPNIRCGLPTRDADRIFYPVNTVAVNPAQTLILAGTSEGVLKSADGAEFVPCSDTIFNEKVTLPDTWLFCSGTHVIEVETSHG